MQKEVLYRYFEGSCSDEEARTIREWVESSPENLQRLFSERKIFDAITLLAVPKPTISGKGKRSAIFSFFPEWLRIAAAVVVAVVLTFWFQHKIFTRELMAQQTVTVPTGQRVNLILSDGSSVWLNSRTTMSYPLSFGHSTREVKVRGEAYFEVAVNKKKPFIVHTDNLTLEVLGTKFYVDDYGMKDNFSASLIEGSLKVSKPGADSKCLTLTPDYMIVSNRDSLVKKEIKDYARYNWREGLICFNDKSFKEVMSTLEKCYGIKIIIENKEVLKYVLTGKFRQVDGINYALNVLQKEVKFQYTREEDKYIYIK